MARFLLDSNVIVAAVSSWHEHHEAAIGELERRVAAGEAMVIAGHTLLESYAVLTRLPAPYRLSAADAHALITANFIGTADVAALDSRSYIELLERIGTGGVTGGQSYDALIAECARQAGVDTLLTFNERHFRGLLDRTVALVVPSVR